MVYAKINDMKQSDPFLHMVNVLSRFYPVSPAFVLRLREFIHLVEFTAGDRLLYYKQMQREIWFVLDGGIAEISRDLYMGEETTTWLWFQDDFLFTSPGFFSQQPAESCIELLQDGRFLSLAVEDFQLLKKEFPQTQQLTENIRDHYHKLRIRHIMEMKWTAAKRIKKLYNLQPELFTPGLRNKLASFFCIDPDTLSRIVKQLKGG